MGIYDREYYRDETAGSGWFYGIAPACRTLILINIVAFIGQAVFSGLTEAFDARPIEIFQKFQIYRLVTASFLHDLHSPFHIVWNMLWLWYLGQEMESMYGKWEFTGMYLAAAVISNLCWSLFTYFSYAPGLPYHFPSALGASGAVSAVVVLYALYFPRREFQIFFLLPVQLWLLVVIFLGVDAIRFIQDLKGVPGATAGIAVSAHLSGALYGYLYKTFDLRWSRIQWPWVRRPRLRIVKPDGYRRERQRDRDRERDVPVSGSSSRAVSGSSSSRPAPSVMHSEEQLDARLDEVLAKIAREGRGGLTEEENRILQEASRRARSRRSDRV
jgi:membrane associated rhomboid family serine protease